MQEGRKSGEGGEGRYENCQLKQVKIALPITAGRMNGGKERLVATRLRKKKVIGVPPVQRHAPHSGLKTRKSQKHGPFSGGEEN